MTIKYADRVQETSVSTGAGDLVLDGAVAGFRSINVAFSNDFDATALDFDYVIKSDVNNTFEIGTGKLTTSTLMERTTVTQNSDEDTSKINFATGGLTITVTPSKDTLANLEVIQLLINSLAVLTATVLGSTVVTSSLTSLGVVNAGSITSGFGNIDNGSSTLASGAHTIATGDLLLSDGDATINGVLSIGAELSVAIDSGGAITVVNSLISIDTFASASSDNLDTINGGVEGDILKIRAVSDSRTVVVKDGVGNIRCAGDFSMDNQLDSMNLTFKEGNWHEDSRSNNAA